jgi:uncharacterized membrane protein HdeD (DUF308 family)
MSDSSVPSPPPPVEYRDLDDQGWTISVLGGVVTLVFGVWLLTNLFESVVVLAILAGVTLILGGIAEVVALGGKEAMGWPAWVAGALMVVTGIVIAAWPDITLWALAVVAGAGLIAAGALWIAMAVVLGDRVSDRPLRLALGAVAIVVGIVVLAWPGATLVVLAIAFGLQAIATGLVAIAVGWRIHRLATSP